jgi:5-methylcytosine-specific restriction endonuclease McrA
MSEYLTKGSFVDVYNETQTAIYDITDNNLFDINEKIHETRIKIEVELNKQNMEGLKDKCKELGLSGFSKQKKPELVQSLLHEFTKLVEQLKDRKANELKTICKLHNIKCTTVKKDNLLCYLLDYLFNSLNFKLDDTDVSIAKSKEPKEKEKAPKEKEPSLSEHKLSTTKQKQEMIKQQAEKIDKEKKLQEEKKIQEEKKLLEETKKIEKEEAKKKKQAIPKQVRVIVWNHYIGDDIIKHKCLCCKKVTITNTNFDVGHVLSEKNGGSHEINNLRPICGACNHSMGVENMIDFVVKYGLYIG